MAAVAFGMTACVTPPPEDAAIWDKPPRYGHGGTQADPNSTEGQKKNRFGFGGQDTAAASGGNRFGAGSGNTGNNGSTNSDLGSTAGASGNTVADKGKMDKKTGGSNSKSSPPSNLKSYPFGKPVPGKSGFVTLASPHDGLGEIDVRGIAPGTPVEIPDPTKPGKKIYFRVP